MAQRPRKDDPRIKLRWVLRSGDQLLVASILVLALGLGGAYFAVQKMRSVEYIDIDEVPGYEYQFLVDVNRADWAELAQLPGIGEVLAKRIIESRAAQGPFLDHSDLQRVRGIGPRTVENLRPYLLPMPEAEAIAAEGAGLPSS